MSVENKYTAKRIMASLLWALLGMGTVVLLGAAISKKNNKRCKGVDITINGVKNNFFIDKDQVGSMLEKISSGGLQGKSIHSLNLAGMEYELQKNVWVKNAQLFFDNNEILKINISEREPIARIFMSNGSSFYLDSSLTRLPLSDKFSARVPVFTNFSSANILSKADTNLLIGIKNISTYILADPFWMAQIDQVDITADTTFEMVPKVGNHIIIFGGAENYEQKFNDLLTFYKEVETKVGWNKYSKINVQYAGQIIGIKRGAEDVVQDSLRAKQIMQTMAAVAQKAANDSINNIQLDQPLDDNNNIPAAQNGVNIPEEKPEKKPVVALPKIIPPANKINPLVKQPSATVNNNTVIKKTLPNATTVSKQSKSQINKIKIPSTKKQNPIPNKPNATKSTLPKPVVKPQAKPATQPTNDY